MQSASKMPRQAAPKFTEWMGVLETLIRLGKLHHYDSSRKKKKILLKKSALLLVASGVECF